MTNPRIGDEELGGLVSANDPQVRRLAGEVLRLRNAIATHAAKRGNELCWLNDVALWKSVGIDAGYPHDSLPVREEFLAQCARDHASRLTGTPYEEPAMKVPITQKPA